MINASMEEQTEYQFLILGNVDKCQNLSPELYSYQFLILGNVVELTGYDLYCLERINS